MQDPMEQARLKTVLAPPRLGRGATREAWIAWAETVMVVNHGLQDIIERQIRVIRDLRAEMQLLRQRIAERKPPGGRAALADTLVSRLEEDIERGGSDRTIATRYGISHMSVYRVRKRVRQRQAAGTAVDGKAPR